MEQSGIQNPSPALSPWDPKRALRRIDPLHVRLSRGFLRCRPEKWFPGFSAQWLPLAHALGAEIRFIEVQPFLGAPHGLEIGFVGAIDEDPIALMLDLNSARVLREAFIPGAGEDVSDVLLEYLARRLLGSLAISWSGPESSQVKFQREVSSQAVQCAGAVKLSFSVNGSQCSVWLLLGLQTVERLDGLWTRQLRSSTRNLDRQEEIVIEVSQLAVTPQMLVDYVRPGTVIDLEVPVSDLVTLRNQGKAWLPARLCSVDGALACETIVGTPPAGALPEGATRLSIELGSFMLGAGELTNASQIGAIYDSAVQASNLVRMVVNGEKVAEATLCTYEGRFAVSVK